MSPSPLTAAGVALTLLATPAVAAAQERCEWPTMTFVKENDDWLRMVAVAQWFDRHAEIRVTYELRSPDGVSLDHESETIRARDPAHAERIFRAMCGEALAS